MLPLTEPCLAHKSFKMTNSITHPSCWALIWPNESSLCPWTSLQPPHLGPFRAADDQNMFVDWKKKWLRLAHGTDIKGHKENLTSLLRLLKPVSVKQIRERAKKNANNNGVNTSIGFTTYQCSMRFTCINSFNLQTPLVLSLYSFNGRENQASKS